jgi:hypothetical protein
MSAAGEPVDRVGLATNTSSDRACENSRAACVSGHPFRVKRGSTAQWSGIGTATVLIGLGAFLAFGDDWTVAAGVAAALATVGILSREGVNAWWLLPLAIALLTAISVWRQASSSSDDDRSGPG